MKTKGSCARPFDCDASGSERPAVEVPIKAKIVHGACGYLLRATRRGDEDEEVTAER